MKSTQQQPAQKRIKTKPQLKDSPTRVQELQLELIELVEHNSLKGKKVAKLLRDNRHLWRGTMMPSRRLDSLRDMENGYWSADTLYILPKEGQEDALDKLAPKFRADEITWLGGKESVELLGFWKKGIENNPSLVLALWWD